MSEMAMHLGHALETWDRWGWPRPAALLVSGSGLALDLLPDLASEARPLADLLTFRIDSIVGHPLSVALLGGDTRWPVVYQRGRIHSYQGHDANETVFMVRLAALLGAQQIFQTNAAGSLRREIAPGELVLITDHINLMGLNPLRGDLPETWGPQFPDMTTAYCSELRAEARNVAARQNLTLHEGVYAGVAGPSYETAAEIQMLSTMGADMVGMSTVLEVIAARHMGVDNLAISMISNLATGITDAPLDHGEVLEVARVAAGRLKTLLEALLSARMGL